MRFFGLGQALISAPVPGFPSAAADDRGAPLTKTPIAGRPGSARNDDCCISPYATTPARRKREFGFSSLFDRRLPGLL